MKSIKLCLLRLVINLFYQFFLLFCRVDSTKITLATNRNAELFAGLKNIQKIFNEKGSFKITAISFNFERTLYGRVKYLFNSIGSVYHLATSRFFIIDDYFFPVYCINKNKKNNVIQIWHAIGHLKKFGLSIPSNNSSIIKHHSNYDFAIVNSTEDIPYYAEAFGMTKEKVISLGNPKVDGLYLYSDLVGSREKNGKKKLLYAPTYRKDNQDSVEIIESFLSSFEHLTSIFDIYISLHPYVTYKKNINIDGITIFQDGNFSEQILPKIDLMITDYSSIMLEYSYFEKPLLIFAPDVNTYTKDVGFYVDFPKYVEAPIFTSISQLTYFVETGEYLNDLNYILALKNKVFDYVEGSNAERLYNFIVEQTKY